MKNRLISLLLLAVTVTASACGASAENPETTAPSVSAAEETAAVQTEETIALPDHKLDLGGRDFSVLYFDPVQDWGWNSNTPSDINIAEETGEVLGDAVYNRNRKIEEMYNVSIKAVPSTAANIHPQLKKSVMANAAAYDAALLIQNGMITPVAEGLIVQLDDILNFNDPWWDSNSLEGLSVCGKTFAVAGDMTFMDKLIAIGVFFNKNMAEDYQLGDIYKLVVDGNWTFDKMLEMGEIVSEDINGDSKYDTNDRYGFSGQNDAAYELLQSAGERFCSLDDDGIPYISNNSERAVSVMVKIYEFMNNKAQFFNRQAAGLNITDTIKMFLSNQVLFLMRPLSSLFDLRAMEADFGIIPTPKMDNNQSEYYTSIGYTGSPLVTIPVDAVSVDESAKLLDTLNAESYFNVNPAFYDIVLGAKLTRDDNSTENLDLILNNRIYDPGCIFGFGGMASSFMKAGNPDTVVSTIESIAPKVEADIEKLVQLMQ